MKMLFVTTAFYPEQAIGAVRLTKIVKFAAQAGHDVTVLSLAPPPWAVRDDSLWFKELDEIRWRSIPQSTFFRRILQRARVSAIGSRSGLDVTGKGEPSGSTLSSMRSTAQFLYTFLKAIDWMAQIRRHVVHELNGERFDVIFTSYPSLASPFAGVMLKSMHRSRLLMIDFRDPITYGRARRFTARRIIEKWLLKRAEIVTFASTGVRTKVTSRDDVPPSTMKVVPNGFDTDDIFRSEPVNVGDVQKTLHFAYVGSLYGGRRDMSPFFMALRQALHCNPDSQLGITIHYAGLEGHIFRSQAARYGLDSLVREHGRIPRTKSLGLQQAVDVCLLSTWNTPDDQGILTGKIFEFFMARKPVVAVVNGCLAGSEIRQMIESIGAGFCYEESVAVDMPDLVDWLKQILLEKAATGRVITEYQSGVMAYDFRAVCQKLFRSVDQFLFDTAQ